MVVAPTRTWHVECSLFDSKRSLYLTHLFTFPIPPHIIGTQSNTARLPRQPTGVPTVDQGQILSVITNGTETGVSGKCRR